MTKPTGDKTPPPPARSLVKLNARSLLTLLSDDQPQSWHPITASLGAKEPYEIKRARQLLKGLIGQGEITELDGRRYALANARANSQGLGNMPRAPEAEAQIDTLQGAVQGEAIGYGGKLVMDGLPIIRSQDRRKDVPAARLGDTVVYHRFEQASGAGQLEDSRRAAPRSAAYRWRGRAHKRGQRGHTTHVIYSQRRSS